MIQVKINDKHEFTVEGNTLNGAETSWDIIALNDHSFHVIRNNKSYNAVLVNFDREEKTMTIKVNGTEYELSIRDKFDLLLQKMGISATASSAVQNIKAPMPGLIISISVNVGDEVKKGDALLILEAMKMENVIKSPRDGKVKAVKVELRKAVEKNQVLVEFE
jgi:biotin carboxyl carrier protein